LLYFTREIKEVANSQWLPIRRKWEMLAWRDLDLGPIFFERGGPYYLGANDSLSIGCRNDIYNE